MIKGCTRLGEAEAVDSLGEVVHADVLWFGSVLKEFLRRTTQSEPSSFWTSGFKFSLPDHPPE